MTYVPGYEHDVFVSYAHFDNEEDSQDVRWVSRFQADLKNALRQRLGEDPEIFYDTRNFEAHEPRRCPARECAALGGLPRRILAELPGAGFHHRRARGLRRAPPTPIGW